MANTYKALSSVTVGSGGVASVSFTNIPQTYTDLVIQISARSNYTAGSYGDGLRVSFNSDTSTSNYSNRYFQAYDASADSGSSSASLVTGLIPDDAAAQTANVFSNNEHYIPNYASNILKKSISVQNVVEKNGTTNWVLQRYSILYNSTAPITSITYTPSTSFVFKEFTTFTLYGVFNADVSSAPATPTIGTATAGVESASITFTPVSNAASYTMISTPGSITGTGTTSPITVSGLTGETAYTFKVKSNNPFGSSAESAASNSVTPTFPLSYESIATINAGGQTQVAFTSIPQTYSHLQLRMMVRSTINTGGYTQATVVLRINGSAIRGGIYAFHEFNGNGSTAASYGTTSSQEAYGVAVPTANIASNVFGVSTIDFLDYANTNKYKTWRGITGWDDNSSLGFARLFSGVMLETNAISSMYFSTDYNFAWASGTVFALYGIKSA